MCFASGSRPSYADTESINLGAFAFCASPAETLPRQRCFDFSGFQVVQFSRATRAARSRIHFSNFEFFSGFSCVLCEHRTRRRFFDFSHFRMFALSRVTGAHGAGRYFWIFCVFVFSRPTCTQSTLRLFDFSGFRTAPGRLRIGNNTKQSVKIHKGGFGLFVYFYK